MPTARLRRLVGPLFHCASRRLAGQTPAKRLLRLRVVRLSGRQLSWWHAYTRFGGYVVWVVTGLLGFAEILSDANRQGLHDKVARTVVVHEPAGGGQLRGVEWCGHLFGAGDAGDGQR